MTPADGATSSAKAASVEDRLNALIATFTPDPWTTLGSPSITNFTSDHARYRFTDSSQTEVEIDIVGHATGAVGGGQNTYANTLTVAYRPSVKRAYPVGNTAPVGSTNSGWITVTTGGTVTLDVPTMANGDVLGCNIRMPLD